MLHSFSAVFLTIHFILWHFQFVLSQMVGFSAPFSAFILLRFFPYTIFTLVSCALLLYAFFPLNFHVLELFFLSSICELWCSFSVILIEIDKSKSTSFKTKKFLYVHSSRHFLFGLRLLGYVVYICCLSYLITFTFTLCALCTLFLCV